MKTITKSLNPLMKGEVSLQYLAGPRVYLMAYLSLVCSDGELLPVDVSSLHLVQSEGE